MQYMISRWLLVTLMSKMALLSVTYFHMAFTRVAGSSSSSSLYSYVQGGSLELTLEISCCKHPPQRTLRQFWAENIRPLIRLMEETHRGVKGMYRKTEGTSVSGRGIIAYIHGRDNRWPSLLTIAVKVFFYLANVLMQLSSLAESCSIVSSLTIGSR